MAGLGCVHVQPSPLRLRIQEEHALKAEHCPDMMQLARKIRREVMTIILQTSQSCCKLPYWRKGACLHP